jgi:hypothetical protein
MTFISDLTRGRADSIPFCCRLHWALTYALDRESGQARRRGICFTADETPYVPCGILHQPTMTHAEFSERLALDWWPEGMPT